MKRVALIAFILVVPAIVHAAPMEQCSYKTENNGKITSITESPSIADGSNLKRFADIAAKASAGIEGYKEYRYFDVDCRALDDKKTEFHLFVQTQNGQVSMQHGLTENVCYYMLSVIRGDRRSYCNGCVYTVEPNDFVRGECFK